MKFKILFFFLFGAAASIYSQSMLIVTTGAEITVSTGADICADSVAGIIQGGGTICGSPNSVDLEVGEKIPREFSLEQNFPNPFNPTTKISWQSPVSSHQTLKVYDVLGNELTVLVNQFLEAGSYSIVFDASSLTSGIYIYRIQSGSFVQTKKMILLK